MDRDRLDELSIEELKNEAAMGLCLPFLRIS